MLTLARFDTPGRLREGSDAARLTRWSREQSALRQRRRRHPADLARRPVLQPDPPSKFYDERECAQQMEVVP
jgi:hypothetical protein